jgi:hypothetical protein
MPPDDPYAAYKKLPKAHPKAREAAVSRCRRPRLHRETSKADPSGGRPAAAAYPYPMTSY